MNAGVVLFVSILLVIFGIAKGLSERRFDNKIKMRLAIIIGGIGVLHFIISVSMIIGSKSFADYWIKEKMLVVQNPGDGNYYLDMGDRYHELNNFYSSDFTSLKKDSCVVYKPGGTTFLYGYIWLPPSRAVEDWEIKRGDDIIYERLIKLNPQPVELK